MQNMLVGCFGSKKNNIGLLLYKQHIFIETGINKGKMIYAVIPH
jgi:hypothetical protein